MLKCIVVDDEELALDLLEDYISNMPYLELKARCKNAVEALKIVRSKPVDVIFLDIQMPGMTGLQLIRNMAHKPMVILISAYEKYAIEGFNLDVIDYLVKPVAFDRFMKACNKAREYQQFINRQSNVKEVLHPDYFFVSSDYKLVKINFDDVIWIEGLKDYLKIHVRNTDKPVITLMTMKSIVDQLPEAHFIRIHKSYLVSVSHITAIRKNSLFIDTMELPIGGNYKAAIDALVQGLKK